MRAWCSSVTTHSQVQSMCQGSPVHLKKLLKPSWTRTRKDVLKMQFEREKIEDLSEERCIRAKELPAAVDRRMDRQTNSRNCNTDCSLQFQPHPPSARRSLVVPSRVTADCHIFRKHSLALLHTWIPCKGEEL